MFCYVILTNEIYIFIIFLIISGSRFNIEMTEKINFIFFMATHCDICQRGPQRSQTRSHSNIKTIRRQHLNLQKKTIDGVQKNICTRCIRTLKKNLVK